MATAYCKICGDTKTHYPVDANCILIDLECGHVFNWADGNCYTKKQIEEEGLTILSRTISTIFSETRRKKQIALQAVQDII